MVLLRILIFTITFGVIFGIICTNVKPKQEHCRVLTGIVCTTRDIELAPKLYNALLSNTVGDIMVVTRETDHETIQFWKDKAIVKTVPHYTIEGRHNIEQIAMKRTIIMNHAQTFNYDAVWFVDSDVIPTSGVLQELEKTKADVCIAPYKIKWLGSPCVGIYSVNPPHVSIHKIGLFDTLFARKPCIIAGFGCTFVKRTAFSQKIQCGVIEDANRKVLGEDVGFFMNCYKAGLTVEYLPRWIQNHVL